MIGKMTKAEYLTVYVTEADLLKIIKEQNIYCHAFTIGDLRVEIRVISEDEEKKRKEGIII